MHSSEDLKIGTIIDIHDPYSYHPKHKYSVIVGIDHDQIVLGTVFINSEINPSAINSEALASLQYEIKAAHYHFLAKDSFIDCSNLEDRISTSVVNSLNNGGRILGQLKKSDLHSVISLVLNAPSILPYYIKACNVKAL